MDGSVESLLAWKSAAVGAWFVLFFVGERLRPAAPAPAAAEAPLGARDWRRPGWRRIGRAAGLWGLNAGLAPLIVLPLLFWASGVELGLRPEWWRGWPAFLLDIVVLDFVTYWWHRANHEAPVLWRFHQVHHLDEFLDSTSAVRFHFGEVLLSALVRAAAIIVLGVSVAAMVAFEGLVLIAAIFHHSNLRLAPGLEGALSRVVITPSIHWVHHHVRESDLMSNYGTVFSFWDRIFRTRSWTPRTPDMGIGLAGRTDESFPRLILRPLRPQG